MKNGIVLFLLIVVSSASSAYNWQLENLNQNLQDVNWGLQQQNKQLQRQNDALYDAAWEMRRAADESARAADESAKLRKTKELAVTIQLEAERQRRQDAADMMAQEQVRTQIEAARLAEQRKHNDTMEKLKAVEILERRRIQSEQDAYRCEWTENGLRCPAMKADGTSYCANHVAVAQKQALALSRLMADIARRDREIERKFKEQPPCKAQCGRPSLPNTEWCAIHQPGARNPYEGMTAEEEVAAKISKTKEIMADIEKNISQYKKMTKGNLPSGLKELQMSMSTGAVSRLTDEWGKEIYYETDGFNYAMQSAGPDKQFETPDDITIIRRFDK